jgi:protein TonB
MTNNTNRGTSMDDTVFVYRNKSYGAFQLRKEFLKNFIVAMGISATIVVLFFAAYSYFLQNKEEEPPKEIMTEVPLIDVALDKETPEPEEIKVPPPQVEQIKFVPFEVVDVVKTDEIPPDQTALDTAANVGDKNEKGVDSTGIPEEGTGDKKLGEDGDDDFLTFITEDAQFPGGKKALEKFIQKNFVYPKKALRDEKGGIAKIYFEIDKEGNMSNVKLLKGFDPECDAEAIRVVKLMESIKWTPAKQNGRAGRQKRSIPINFSPPKDDE